MIVVVVFALGNLIWNWNGHLVWFHLCVGAAYAFHVTLMFHTLQTRQSDITSHGYLFSAVVIFLGNVCVLLFGIPLLTARIKLLDVLGWWADGTGMILHWLQRVI